MEHTLTTSHVVSARALSSLPFQKELKSFYNDIFFPIPRPETRLSAAAYVKSLMTSVERKNSWQMAEACGFENPYAFQHLLLRASWDAREVQDCVVHYLRTHLCKTPVGLCLDETGFLKKGVQSAGVSRQYSGTAGRIENCQIGVFLSYVSEEGHGFLDGELYLPQCWTEDSDRRERAHIPDSRPFLTKGQLAVQMLERAYAQGVESTWVTGDEVYGKDGRLRLYLESQRKAYVLAVPSNTYVWRGFRQVTVEELSSQLKKNNWHKPLIDMGSKGVKDWAWSLERTNWTDDREDASKWFRGVLFRKHPLTEELSFYLVFARRGTDLADICHAAGQRWTIEECFQMAKGELGMGHYEVRSYPGWYRHMTLVFAAFAFLNVMRKQANKVLTKSDSQEKKIPRPRKTNPAKNTMQAFYRSRNLY